VHQSARTAITLGAGLLGSSALIAAVTVAAGVPDAAGRLSVLVPVAAGGATVLVMGLVRLRNWAKTRMQQMDDIASRFR
jgi:hypothetical protein